MTKQQKMTFWLSLVFGVILWAGYGLNRYVDSFSPWLLAESESPAHLGKAAFLVDAGSFAGSDTYFFVRDAAKPGAKHLRIGGPYISDGPIKMKEAVWSKDGSVIAVRVRVGEAAGKGFSRYDGTFWIDAYDFRKHQAVSQGKKIGDRSKAIEVLLAERGGAGSKTVSEISLIGREASNSEARTFDTSDKNYDDFR